MGRFRRKQDEGPSTEEMEAQAEEQAKRQAAAAAKKAEQEEMQLRKTDPLLTLIDPEGPDVPRQRGLIPDNKAELMRLQLQTADMIRKKVLAPNLDLDMPLERTPEHEQKARKAIDSLVSSGRVKIPRGVDKETFYTDTMYEIFGFGPLQRFINAEGVSEIMVNGPFIIFIERKGRIIESGYKFLDDDHCERIIRRIVKPLGRLANSENALVDARLPDGSRVNAVLRPVALDGPSISIRKFSKEKLTVKNLISFGSMTPEMAQFLEAIVVARQNIVVSGGTGSGKTTLINCLSGFIPEHERTVTIEDAAELQLTQRNVVRLETKKPTPQAPSEITIRDCVRNALRMRPERIVVGECRGGETLDMLQAMNTGHDGSLTTVHSNDPRACISRLETLVLMAGMDMPLSIVRKQIADSIHFIVQAARLRDGSRKVTHITEVQGMEGDTVILSEIFKFQDNGDNADGNIDGYHTATGLRPKCDGILKQYNVAVPATVYRPTKR
ncbi:MAG TPA: CpaF family protein [Anaerolineae bacterium]|nr:CpaF family protein [Anaerolineae bacterium]